MTVKTVFRGLDVPFKPTRNMINGSEYPDCRSTCKRRKDDCCGCIYDPLKRDMEYRTFMNFLKENPEVYDNWDTDVALAEKGLESSVNNWYGGVLMRASDDLVNHPDHYCRGGIECIDAMIAAKGIEKVQAFCECCAFKYLFRSDNKGGNMDLSKARWYLEKYAELEEKKNVNKEKSTD